MKMLLQLFGLWLIVSFILFVLYWAACRLAARADRNEALPANERYAMWDAQQWEENMDGYVKSETVAVETKSIFASKMFWINAITIAIAIIAITNPEMIGVNPAHVAWASGVLNIFLRFLTNQPVSLTGGDTAQVKRG